MNLLCLASGARLNIPVKDVTTAILNEWKIIIHFNFNLSRQQKWCCSSEPGIDSGSGVGNGSLALTFYHVDISNAFSIVMNKPTSITEETFQTV